MTKGDHDILFSGYAVVDEDKHVNLDGEVQHLACFAGGMIGIGVKMFDSPDDRKVARALVDGCVWAYEHMVTGIMPEVLHVLPCNEHGPCRWDQQRWHSAILDTTSNSSSNEYPSEAQVESKIQEDRLQPGNYKCGRPKVHSKVSLCCVITPFEGSFLSVGNSNFQSLDPKQSNRSSSCMGSPEIPPFSTKPGPCSKTHTNGDCQRCN